MKTLNKKIVSLCVVAGTLLSAQQSFAGGMEASWLNHGVLFHQDDKVLQSSVALYQADQDGSDVFNNKTGSAAQDQWFVKLAYKHQLNDQTALALTYHRGLSAHQKYPTNSIYNGLSAKWVGDVYSVLAKHDVWNSALSNSWQQKISLYGGAKLLISEAKVTVPATPTANPVTDPRAYPYRAESDTNYAPGYVAGIAYQIPDIALMLRLTYETAITHRFKYSEAVISSVPALNLRQSSNASVEVPASWQLDIQTGIASDTLLFAIIRRVDWRPFKVEPPLFKQATGNGLVVFKRINYAFSGGVGHKFSSSWSAALGYDYEEGSDGALNPLLPSSGYRGPTAGLSYSWAKSKVSLGGYYYQALNSGKDVSGLSEFKDMTSHSIYLGFDQSF